MNNAIHHTTHYAIIGLFFQVLFILVIISSCQLDETNFVKPPQIIPNQFAQNFSIQQRADYTILTVQDAYEGARDSFQYILYKDENKRPTNYPNATFIQLPIRRSVAMSTTHVAMLTALQQDTTIVGVAGLLYNERLQQQVTSGKIQNLGDGATLNYEQLLALAPDVVFTFGVNDLESVQKIKSLGMKPVVVSEFRDDSPLARAEWLRFFACFYDALPLADTIFQNVVRDYQATKIQAALLSNLPKVFTGIPYQGTWYVPSGESFVAQFIRDAGGNYIWKDSQGTMSLALDVEAVFAQAQHAQKWLDVGYVFSKDAVAQSDSRFTQFDAFQTGEMYNYTKRVSAAGGFDIYESAVVRPDLVLKDIAKALHPQLLPAHEFYYYERLE